MHKSIPVVFKRSLLAAAILSVSACSSLPQMPDIDMSPVSNGLAKAGRATANVGSRAWNNTAYYLGFRDSRDGSDEDPSDSQLLIADSYSNDANTETLQIAALDENGLPSDRPLAIEQTNNQQTDDSGQLLQTAGQTSSDSNSSAQQDLIHEVAQNETLWDIAKMTTGDATNWHALADINNLQQNAAVYPGQELLVPGSMVKPDYNPNAAAPEILAANPDDTVETISLSDNAAVITDSANESTLAASSEAPSVNPNATTIKLEEGETLWDFAKRTTGNATNWKQIASANNFTESQATKVRPGQRIDVPTELLRESNEATTAASVVQDDQASDAVITVGNAATEAAESASDAGQALLAAAQPEAQSLKDELVEGAGELAAAVPEATESQDMQIVEANYQSTDVIDPAKLEDDVAQMAENENIPAAITVKGTYYPKAVYNDADFSSSLLMRVSPGTRLQVSRAMGTWYEVETEKGVGYVHARDTQ